MYSMGPGDPIPPPQRLPQMLNFMAYVGILFGLGLELLTSKVPRTTGVLVTLLLVGSNVYLLWGRREAGWGYRSQERVATWPSALNVTIGH